MATTAFSKTTEKKRKEKKWRRKSKTKIRDKLEIDCKMGQKPQKESSGTIDR